MSLRPNNVVPQTTQQTKATIGSGEVETEHVLGGPRTAHGLMKTQMNPNLLRRPAKPAFGNGHIQRGVERALIAHNGGPITTSTAAEWAYALRQYQGKRLKSVNYVYLRRALDRVADRVGHGRGRGRPWLWTRVQRNGS